MSSVARHAPPPTHDTGPFVSLAEWDRDWSRRDEDYELVDGHPLVTPSEAYPHVEAASLLTVQLIPILTPGLIVLPHFDVRIGGSDLRPTIRCPDLVVARRVLRATDRRFDASHVLLVAEVLSSSTERTDVRDKRAEYATAGIPHYLLVDVRNQPTVQHLADPHDGDYRSEASGPSVTLRLDRHDITIRAEDLVL